MNIILSNALFLKNVPDAIRQTLIKDLQFQNPKWLENQRLGRWNHGTPKHLKFHKSFGKDGLVIPKGYMRHLILLCRQMEEPIEIDDQRRSFDDVPFDFKGTLKSFQKDAIEKMLPKDFGTLNAPTGSGKTVLALYMVAKRKQPALIVVHTKDLAHQWVARIETFLGIEKADVGFIGGGKMKMGNQITVALVQSLYKFSQEASKQVGFLIVDECHRAPSRTFTEAVRAFDGKYMLGLSATPFRRDKLSRLIFWHLGDIHHSIEKKELEEKGHILEVESVMRKTNFSPYYDPVNEYSKMLSELTSDDERNDLIAQDVINEVKNASSSNVCLVLSDRKKHCETLCSILRFKYHQPAELLTGDLSLPERNEVLEKIKAKKVKVLVATGQLVGEGFDCKELSTLFLATPIRFTGRVIQYLGRILRPDEGKRKARVYDYVDVNVDVLRVAAEYRQHVYEPEIDGMR